MSLKKVVILALKVAVLAVAMFVCTSVAASVAGLVGSVGELAPEDTAQAAALLLVVCLINTAVLTYPILRSRWHGLKLMAAVAVVLYGAQMFMAQIEAVVFNSALKIPNSAFPYLAVSGALTALLFAPVAVIVFGKMRAEPEQESPNVRLVMSGRAWAWRLAILPVSYLFLYLLFGHFVAWQFPAVREFYTGSPANDPALVESAGLPGWSLLVPLQLGRGLLWVAIALPVVRMMKGRPWETGLAVGLLFALLLTSQLLLPNPFMPANVRMAHLLETSTSTFLFGFLVGWLLSRGSDAGHAVESTSTVEPMPKNGLAAL